MIRSSIARLSALSRLSSTIRMRSDDFGAGWLALLAAAPAARTPPTTSGRRTTNSDPLPGPSLRASIRPPCISTSRFTSVSPIPSPPCDRSSDRPRPARTSRRCAGSWSAAMPMPVSLHRHHHVAPLPLGGQPDVPAPVAVLGSVVEQVGRTPGPAGSGRRPAMSGCVRQRHGELRDPCGRSGGGSSRPHARRPPPVDPLLAESPACRW